ncbi:hypothetical protein AG1IA_08273 [Rhizoctonia solani AG-1 IA]|uniref:Uncharacterized protein n=1 Tax=Thanatephorus cucumeris (strain AG1-IA) TaxID=983506 RepID=L8WHK5_THACA|nr:hypothetical protein AG1IA_08273 [Rhizoctonia solani AG-1 IA]
MLARLHLLLSATRSFTEPPGLRNSAFPYLRTLITYSMNKLILTKGVFPVPNSKYLRCRSGPNPPRNQSWCLTYQPDNPVHDLIASQFDRSRNVITSTLCFFSISTEQCLGIRHLLQGRRIQGDDEPNATPIVISLDARFGAQSDHLTDMVEIGYGYNQQLFHNATIASCAQQYKAPILWYATGAERLDFPPLVILQEFMKRVQSQMGLADAPRICEVFDLIAVTETGRVSSWDSLQWSWDAQSDPTRPREQAPFERDNIWDDNPRECNSSHSKALYRATRYRNDPSRFVCVVQAESVTAGMPTLIRTCTVPADDGPRCRMAQALRATTATTGYFSIGAGETHAIRLGSKDLGKRIAKDSERVAQETVQRFQYTGGLHSRFNVNQDLYDIRTTGWERMLEVAIHTWQYMRMSEVGSNLNQAVIPPIEAVKRFRNCPPPSPAFVGQEGALKKIEKSFWDEIEDQHVFVLYGLGGGDKTQVALKFAQIYRNKQQ